MTIPHNIKYTIGNDLREVPDDIEEFEKGIAFLEKKLADADTNIDKAYLFSKLGALNRIIGHLQESLKHLTFAQLFIHDKDENRLYVINEIRLATTLQFIGKFEVAEQIHNKLEHHIKTTNTHEDLLDFVYQHKGKNYYEWGKFDLALHEFEKALVIRKTKEDDALIHSTEIAIQKIKELI